jgi:hypothetical protein
MSRVASKSVASKSRPRSLPRWQISRIKATPAVDIGHPIEAPDADTAIRRAIEQFEITNPEHQKRLVARRVA